MVNLRPCGDPAGFSLRIFTSEKHFGFAARCALDCAGIFFHNCAVQRACIVRSFELMGYAEASYLYCITGQIASKSPEIQN